MPLESVPTGSYVRLDSLEVMPELRYRCQTLGLLAGENIEVVANRRPCPLIIAASGARLMLGRELAIALSVTPLGCGDHA
jgi:Fe2+ transport system protein FeoA